MTTISAFPIGNLSAILIRNDASKIAQNALKNMTDNRNRIF